MTWMPTDHRLGVCHVDEQGGIDPSRPMADIDVVRLALDGAYTVVHTPETGQRAIMLGLRSPPLASRLTMTLASGTSSSIHELSFHRGDLAWATKAVLGASSLVAAEAVPILPAEPTVWLEANWPAVTAALSHPHVLIPVRRRVSAAAPTARWAVQACSDPLRTTLEARSRTVDSRLHQAGELTWALTFVDHGGDAADEGPRDEVAPGRGAGRRRQWAPWWDLGAWYFDRTRPRI